MAFASTHSMAPMNLRGDPITTTETVRFLGSPIFLPAPHPPLPEPSPTKVAPQISDSSSQTEVTGDLRGVGFEHPQNPWKNIEKIWPPKKPKVIYHTKLLKHVGSNWNLRGPLGGWSSQETDVSVVNWLFSSPRPRVGYSPSRWPFTHFHGWNAWGAHPNYMGGPS